MAKETVRDSLGELEPTKPENSSPTSSKPQRTPAQRYAAKVTPKKIAELLARLSVVYGTPWGRDDVGKALLAEWHRALAHIPQECVVAAVERYIGSPATKAPVPGQIIALAQEDTAWLRRQIELDALERSGTRPDVLDDDDIPFKPTEEQMLAIKAACDKWRAEFGDNQTWTDRMDDWTPASQATEVSPELRAAVEKMRLSA